MVWSSEIPSFPCNSWSKHIKGYVRVRAIIVWPWKTISVSVRYFVFKLSSNGWEKQNMDSSLSRQRNPNKEKALFNWPIVLQHDIKPKYQLISIESSRTWRFRLERSLNKPKATSVCICSINQSNQSISVCLVFMFCSRVFISRPYENRSM